MRWADLTGLVASIGCAIHCAAMPIVIGYLPALGLDWIATQGFHQVMAVLCSLIAISAFLPGWRKHQRLMPAAVGLVGLALISSHAFFADDCCADGICTQPDAAVCSDDTCEFCESQTETRDAGDSDLLTSVTANDADPVAAATTTAESSAGKSTFSFFDLLNRLVTPLGGVFLICAHVLNHRLACLCCQGEQPCDGKAA